MNNKEYIQRYFEGKDLGTSISYQGKNHYFSQEMLLEATLSSPPEVHQFVVRILKTGTKKSIQQLMESIAETIVKEHTG